MTEAVLFVLNHVKQIYLLYQGTGMQMTVFWCAVLVLLVLHKKNSGSKEGIVLGYTFACLGIYVFPLTARIIIACIGWDVYWRVIWIFPVTLVIAYVAAAGVAYGKPFLKKALVFAAVCLILASGGKWVLSGENFTVAENPEKLPPYVVDVCDTIMEDAAEQGIDTVKGVFSDEFVCYVRQYNGEIGMPYGRAVLLGKQSSKIYTILHESGGNGKKLVRRMKKKECNYLTLAAGNEFHDSLIENGCVEVAAVDGYLVYRLVED